MPPLSHVKLTRLAQLEGCFRVGIHRCPSGARKIRPGHSFCPMASSPRIFAQTFNRCRQTPELRREISDQVMSLPSFAYTCAVCEVEVDPETGVVEIVCYTSLDDCGRAVNPMLIRGQSHGGIAQGIGQALWEECFYDRDTAQLLSGSLMDYAMPRADSLPLFQTEISEVPSTTNPLGMRGGSEGGI